MRRLGALLLLACLALLAPATLARAQGAYGGANVTITFPGNLVGSFAGISLSTGPGGPGGFSSSFQMPPVARMGNATLSQGSFPASQAFWQFQNNIAMNTIAAARWPWPSPTTRATTSPGCSTTPVPSEYPGRGQAAAAR